MVDRKLEVQAGDLNLYQIRLTVKVDLLPDNLLNLIHTLLGAPKVLLLGFSTRVTHYK